MSLDRILDNLAEHVRHRLEEGERSVEMNPAVLQSLRQPTAHSAPSPSPKVPMSHSPTVPPSHRPPVPQSHGPNVPRSQGPTVPLSHSPTVPQPPSLAAIAQRIATCQTCRLGKTRTCTVPGQGNPHPELVFVGEGPGEDEDAQGLAFVGRAGQLLTRMIIAMGLTREEVWIGNVVKCRPPDNRVPEPDEMAACLPFLREQLAVLKPKVIVALGATAVKGLVNTQTGITKLRGHWLNFAEIPLMPTFHPAYLIRGGGDEKARYWDVWEDMCTVLKRLGRPVPERNKPPAT